MSAILYNELNNNYNRRAIELSCKAAVILNRPKIAKLVQDFTKKTKVAKLTTN